MTLPATSVLSPEEVSALRHDLRTPVNHIVGYCELLLEDLDGEENRSRRESLHAALSTVREILGMINAALPASGMNVTRSDVAELYERIRAPQSCILRAIGTLIVPGETNAEMESDVTKIRDATDRLVAVERPALPSPAPAPRTSPRLTPSTPFAATVRSDECKGRILVVDDVEDNRAVLTRHLKRQGYEVDPAVDGLQALEMAARGAYDLILLDVRMPGIDGYEVLERIKTEPALRDIPVVMISAADELTIIAACIEAGAEDFLSKPFDPVILRARISASIEKKRLRNMEVDYLRQVDCVVEAAHAVERGQYSPGVLAEVARRDDAVGRLARVFDSMAAGIRVREERLNEQVSNLRREIDDAKQGVPGEESPDLDAGTLIPGELFAERYQITRVVGRGGMGTVYKATDNELDEEIAIKLLRSEAMSSDPTMAERFKSEIRLARRISHRNVVRTHDFGETLGSYYVTMEYVEGITLRDLIDMRKRLSPSSTLGIARQLAASLAIAHEVGVIHRDIKPQNLLLDAAGVLKVMDFGIARLAERTSTVTQTGMVVGTPAYMAPEQLLAETVDARSDLYSAGIVLYECLTGGLPFVAGSPIALIAKVLHTVPVPPAAVVPETPAALSSLVVRLISKEAAERPQTAA
ncbi:MAG: protein kinase, partial [Gemmatimonadota bacterium]|nr:protein kinase [Gemmatimonadota bacterium]